ncbi:signal transduction histidine kinase [Novosphingobium sp. PhB55]|uniref:ATP-binding protein n=1 Tax=Novosphingobium sp. PhB55 TaxID=2485106 RepID=UPI0010D7B542|nr:ATP-binding protein [Novosphingobium sp. PhB55]TDW63714.1 signal transduction histidine kinase [Novosphingobium sp. PhB55]
MSSLKMPRPHSLMGQMLLAVAVALMLVQGLGAFLVYRAQREGYEASMLNASAFRLIMETRGPRALSRRHDGPRVPLSGPPPKGYHLEYSTRSPAGPGETRDREAEVGLAKILADQEFPVRDIVVVHRDVGRDRVARRNALDRAANYGLAREEIDRIMRANLLVVGVRTEENGSWIISRVRAPRPENVLLTPVLVQTIIIYIVVMAAVALILRRITRPLAALTRRLERFAATQDVEGQLAPSGPEDMQRLIIAHNAMESRIAALLDEKNVMLGAIGHDLKTPLAALRVRIESVTDDVERGRMAATIEDIVHTLDDILSLARVGRPSDPLERTELSALMFSVIEEYEDMGEPVEVGDTARMALELRPTWIRRALRNLIGNALRYGERARVSLSRAEGRAVILIEDDGPGIPDDAIADMMNPFTRGDPSRNSATGGAGLGLALARAIADQHGGALVLSNRLSAGGTVEGLNARLELPLG